ncbi:MAG: zinc ribbon domain-containing protein [Candidatus Helarchaeota archaeon]
MSDDKDFNPYSSPLPIPGTSYLVQLGKQISSNKWQVRIVKGREIIADRVLAEPELNGNTIIGFIMQEVAIPMINPYQISKTVKLLIKQGERGPLAERPTLMEPPMPEKQGVSSANAPAPSSSSNITTTPVQTASEYDVLMQPRTSTTISTTSTGQEAGTCPRCKSPIEESFYYCPICAKQLKQKYCPGCNREIRPDYQLCPYCGLKL